jgi:hypothetical protein
MRRKASTTLQMGYKYNLLDEELSKKASTSSPELPSPKRAIPYQRIGNVILSIAVVALSVCLYVVQSKPNCLEKWSTYCNVLQEIISGPTLIDWL